MKFRFQARAGEVQEVGKRLGSPGREFHVEKGNWARCGRGPSGGWC